MNRIGAQMVRTGLLEPAQLELALERQRDQGGYLGQHLVDTGFITRQQLYDGLARQWQVERRDLEREPPRPDLLAWHELERVIELGWVPCEVDAGSHVVVATSVRPGPDLVEEVAELFPGLAVTFVACTRRDLDRLAVARSGDRSPAVSAAVRPRSRWCPPAPVRDLLLAAAAVLALSGLLLAPPSALAAALAAVTTMFVLLLAVQAGVAVWCAARSGAHDSAVTTAPVADVLLPVYSVLVPVAGGGAVLDRVVADLRSLDYPTSRLDAVLLVAADDAATRAAVARHAPPSFIRVATVAPAVFADPVLALDAGLVLARGRYVVAVRPDEVPVPDQLRRAVVLFESDLGENLDVRRGRAPLAAARVERREWRSPRSFASGLELVEEMSGLTRAYPWQGQGTDLRADLTSTHCNTRVLRRLGGWRAVREPTEGMRTAVLGSVTRCRWRPSFDDLVGRRADEVVRSLRLAGDRAARLRLRPGLVPPRITDLLLGFATPALLLLSTVVLVTGTCLLLRFRELGADDERLGILGLAAVTVAGTLATVVAGIGLVRRRGWRALGQSATVPALWLVHVVAAWYAVLVLLPCRPPSHGSSTDPRPS